MMLAEKVENHEEFEWARNAGYDLFQGYFFARPVMVRRQHIPAVKTTCLQLLREVQQADLRFDRLERLIREDVSLSYRLLRYANSALFRRTGKIQTITRALLALGEEGIRRWVTLATLPMLATNKPGELVKLSLVRARFCELLTQLAGVARSDTFLMGMFSLLDALIDQPLEEALRSVAVDQEITEALLGSAQDEGFLTCLYHLICCYETGNWDQVERLSEKCGIPMTGIGGAYVDSTVWANQVLDSVGA
jgi:EAL and modified HD-GYP domain-containing signal transduction protein